jgi:metacaspase-1
MWLIPANHLLFFYKLIKYIQTMGQTKSTFKTKKEIQSTREHVKKGLLIGINYIGTSFELGGCIDDATNLKQFLVYNRYFEANDLVTMSDKAVGNLYPTKANILKQLNELVNFASADENKDKDVYLFLSYSGHGAYLQDKNGDEDDNNDEVLCPVDCDKVGYIVDDNLKADFIDKLPSNVKLTILVDACHSGTVMDLRYQYLKKKKTIVNGKVTDSKCTVCMISGCTDSQTSSDAWLPNVISSKYEAQGAMTASFLYNFKDGINYTQLITNMRNWLKNKRFTQIPQLTSGRSINLNDPFLLSSYDI